MTSCFSSLGTFAAFGLAAVKLFGWLETSWTAIVITWTAPALVGFLIDLGIMGTAALRERRSGRKESDQTKLE